MFVDEYFFQDEIIAKNMNDYSVVLLMELAANEQTFCLTATTTACPGHPGGQHQRRHMCVAGLWGRGRG